jgi:hypothetical protein
MRGEPGRDTGVNLSGIDERSAVDERKYADPAAAKAALEKLAENRGVIESWELTTQQLSEIAATLAWGYISFDPHEAAAYYARLGEQDLRRESIEALSWFMVGRSGSDEQMALGRALRWAEGWANH